MPNANIFRWRDGAGWLILAGSGTAGNEVETLALTRLHPGDPIAYVFAASDADTAERHLVALDEAGAPTGYLVDVQTEDDDTLRAQLSQAGLIILGDGLNVATLRGGITGAAIDGIAHAYTQGAIVLGIGAGAAVLGQKFVAGGALRDGFGWLEKSIILPGYQALRDAERMRGFLVDQPALFGLGLGADSALAFGSDGAVESWGARQIAVTLGAAWVNAAQ